MGEITLHNRALSDYTDLEVLEWLGKFGKNKPRGDALRFWLAILRTFDEIGTPMTVREMFYALETRGYIPKTQKWYDKVEYRLLQMRRLKIILYDYIADSTRWMRKPVTFDSLTEFLGRPYRRSLWTDSDVYVEIWIEKDALAGVVYQITQKWDVPLMVTRGFPSETFVYEAAQYIRAMGKPTFLYYFGDYDPSGMAISNNLEKKINEWLGDDVVFNRVAVTAAQVISMKLSTRPTKRSDKRSKGWKGGSVELDAIPANELRRMVEACIIQHVNQSELQRIERIEAAERETLAAVVSKMQKVHAR